MVDYREILRLSSEGNSQRQIAASVGSSHHTVSEVLTTAKLKGIEWSNDDSITNTVHPCHQYRFEKRTGETIRRMRRVLSETG